MAKAFPTAPIYTSLYDPAGTYPEFAETDVRPLFINRIPGLKRHHRLALPLLAPAFGSSEVVADVAVCSSTGWAHGIRTTGRKIVYCNTPARWLYQSDRYLGGRSGVASLALHALRRPLVRWDQRAAATADVYIANSNAVRRQIEIVYGIDSEFLAPPPSFLPEGPREAIPGLEAGFFLCVSRLLPYKNVDAVVDAFAELGDERLVVVGSGPEEARLRQRAAGNVRLVGSVSDAQLRWLYGGCSALIAASYEDFGLTPLEAAGFGKPTVALRFGGFLDTIVEGETGLYFDHPDAAAIVEKVRAARARAWDAQALAAHTDRFSEPKFVKRLREIAHATLERPR
jgi:glycosyltransferase involved in cell wall biosynthesis